MDVSIRGGFPFWAALVIVRLNVVAKGEESPCSLRIVNNTNNNVNAQIENCSYIVLDVRTLSTRRSSTYELVKKTTRLYASKHQTVQLKTGGLLGLKKLRVLNIIENDLVKFQRGSFDYLNELYSLDLSYNNIGTIPLNLFRNLPKLMLLRLIGNKLVVLHGIDFNHLNGLRALFLENNQIRTLTGRIDRAVYVYLNNNMLSNVNPTDFDGYRRVYFVLMGNNIPNDSIIVIKKKVRGVATELHLLN